MDWRNSWCCLLARSTGSRSIRVGRLDLLLMITIMRLDSSILIGCRKIANLIKYYAISRADFKPGKLSYCFQVCLGWKSTKPSINLVLIMKKWRKAIWKKQRNKLKIKNNDLNSFSMLIQFRNSRHQWIYCKIKIARSIIQLLINK